MLCAEILYLLSYKEDAIQKVLLSLSGRLLGLLKVKGIR